MTYWFDKPLAEANRQLKEYRARRALNPEQFGSADGCWDNTPDHGPMALIFDGGLVWGMHKHPWPFEYIYCFGKAWDSKGERTDPLLTLDIRDLPGKYIGRFKLDRPSRGCGRNSHRTILARAVADGYDFATHAALANANAKARLEAADRLRRQTASAVTPVAAFDLLDDDEVPF